MINCKVIKDLLYRTNTIKDFYLFCNMVVNNGWLIRYCILGKKQNIVNVFQVTLPNYCVDCYGIPIDSKSKLCVQIDHIGFQFVFISLLWVVNRLSSSSYLARWAWTSLEGIQILSLKPKLVIVHMMVIVRWWLGGDSSLPPKIKSNLWMGSKQNIFVESISKCLNISKFWISFAQKYIIKSVNSTTN